MKILLAVDGSAYTKRMLGYIAAHDEFLGASHQYHVLHVVPALPPRARSFVDRATLEAYYTAEAEQVMQPVLHFAQQNGWKVSAQHRAGHAGDVISETATEGRFDLVVMGSHGHGAIAGMVLGSVTSRVLSHCGTPLLIVR